MSDQNYREYKKGQRKAQKQRKKNYREKKREHRKGQRIAKKQRKKANR